MKVITCDKSPRDTIIEPALATHSVRIPESIRVGSVPYLNAKPLTRFIESPVATAEPSRLAADLRAGNLDVALVPVMEALESPTDLYYVIDKIAIGSEREVYSVYLNYTVPLAKIQTVALDPASKTSVELARLVLEKFHRLTPRYVAPGEAADAQLLIGDPAITYRQAHPEQNYLDLAAAWREKTSLPFVFAVWAFHKAVWNKRGFSLTSIKERSLPDLLRRAGKAGIAWRDALARTPFERDYLTRHLCYDLGAPQKKAIALFAEMLTQSGRLAIAPKVSYV